MKGKEGMGKAEKDYGMGEVQEWEEGVNSLLWIWWMQKFLIMLFFIHTWPSLAFDPGVSSWAQELKDHKKWRWMK